MFLIVRTGPAAGRVLEVTDGLLVGRDPSSDIALADQKVSRRHAIFRVSPDGQVSLQDLGSTNGSHVDGRRIGEPTALLGSEQVRFGGSIVECSPTRPASSSDPRVGAQVGRYLVKELIAEGSMGMIYGAEHTRTGRQVALKVMNPRLFGSARSKERFLAESRVAGTIEHTNIVPIYDADEVDGVPYIAMKRVRGEDLASIIARQGAVEPTRAVAILTQVASALDAAHGVGLIHRDVKPGNVMITSTADPEGEGKAYLGDFGITKDLSAERGMTMPGHVVGTRDYMAPEQFSGDPVDARTDVYALGCVLFETLTGIRPYAADSEVAMMRAHVEAPPPTPSRVRPELGSAIDAVIAKALAKRKEDRYPTCAALMEDARRALAGPVTAQVTPEPATVTDAPPLLPSGATLVEANAGTLIEATTTSADTRPASSADATGVSVQRDAGGASGSTGAGRRSGMRPSWIVAAAVILVLALVGSYLVFFRPTVSPPQAFQAGFVSFCSALDDEPCNRVQGVVSLSWAIEDGSKKPDGFVVQRNKVDIMSLAGDLLAFQDHVVPDDTYEYRVIALDGEEQMPSEAKTVKVDRPPNSLARIEGTFEITETVTTSSTPDLLGIGDVFGPLETTFAPKACASGPCSAIDLESSAQVVDASLRRRGEMYRGTGEEAIYQCVDANDKVLGDIVVKATYVLAITNATIDEQGEWRATKLQGTLAELEIRQTGGCKLSRYTYDLVIERTT